MTDVLLAYASIAVVIAAGYLIARSGVLGSQAQPVLANVAFYMLIPPLLFTAVANVDISLLASPYMAVVAGTAVAAVTAGAVFALTSKRGGGAAVSLGLAGSYPNAVNIGIPVATQLFGDIRYITPLVLFELVVIIPVSLFAFELLVHRPVRWRRLGVGLAKNPLLIASAAGLTFAFTGWPIPRIVAVPFDILGGAAIPIVLLSFGMSLHNVRPLGSGELTAATTASASKLIIAPLAAFGLGVVFRLPPAELFAVVALSALPTAQNAFIFAQRYDRAAPAVRDTVFVTTVGSGAVMATIVAVFAAVA